MKYEFHEEGTWYGATLASGMMLVFKASEEDLKALNTENIFKAFHVSRYANNGFAHLPSMMGTAEPWFLNSTHFLSLSILDPEMAENMDKMYKEKFSIIQEVKGDVESPTFDQLKKRFGKGLQTPE